MSLPVASRPLADPPTGALPPIPTNKAPRKSLPQTPSRLKAPSRPSVLPSPQPTYSTPDLSKASEKPTGLPSKQVRKTVSIGSFPHPPNASSRPSTSASMNSTASNKKRISNGDSNIAKTRKSPRASAVNSASFRSSQTPSLLNSAGDGMSISIRAGHRISDAQSSIHSPPQSRSSSANGSYSTSATTIEEGDEESRGRTKDLDDINVDSKRNSKGKEVKGNVIVSVRVRPDSNTQNNTQSEGEWMVDGRRALVAYRGKEGGDYHYDNVFSQHDDNAKVYDSAAKRLVRRVMEGYHGTVFAYGMTGTGKTFSMQGTMTSPGVIPLAITDIFSYIRETPHREFLLRVSYLEIYNEKIHDLLAPPTAGPQEEIKLREDSKRGVYASPLKEEIVQSPTQLLRVIHRGDMSRRTGSTQFNSRSSRSHAVVQIVVESRERVPGSGSINENGKRVAMLPGGVRVSTLSLIDLAGSERAAEDKERRTEGAHINKSLLTLGTVIAKLSGTKDKNGNPIDKDGKHLPYRDSKLTRLLQPALSGNSLVSILCTIQIGAGLTMAGNNHTGETLNTLKFAARAKNNIVSHAKKAAEESGSGVSAGLLERYRGEIATLRAQLEGQQKSAVEKEERQLEKEAEQRHEEQMLEMQLARTALKERIEHLNRLILCSKSTGVNSGSVSALGMHSRLSGGTEYAGSRSVRSSASQSTLGVGSGLKRHPSVVSLSAVPSGSAHMSPFSGIPDEDEDGEGGFSEGRATLQAQVRALQSDLQDKTRYIATLERRLLQARRSSHSRVSMAFNKGSGEESDVQRKLDEKDQMISDLQKTVAALRSAVRKREIAELTPEMSSSEFKSSRNQLGHQSSSSNGSAQVLTVSTQPLSGGPRSPLTASPITLLSPQKPQDKKKKTMDEMSKMLDEMIQDKVENGQLAKTRSTSARIPSRSSSNARRESRRTSSAGTGGLGITGARPSLGSMVASLRDRDSTIET
ncbi:hypothetical protein LTR84_009269 [Exophiala bonariae]|uniref:Kinesin-like protein n=1 Tax=Exophiala bonariae TaxID=1690606 RepID=A0AAV9MV98_9EURO|nr:hypothetical protein LTR84_009269 [Exophiala bonariae]